MPSMCRRACLRKPVAATALPLCWSGPIPYPSHMSTMGTVALTCWRKGETCPPSDLLLATTSITVCRSTGIQWHITNSQLGETGRTSLCDPLLDYWIGGTHMLTARETFSMQGCCFPLNSCLPSYLLPLNAICRCLTRSGRRQRVSWGGCLGSCVLDQTTAPGD